MALTDQGIIYRWRSECTADDQALLQLLPPNEVIKYESIRIEPFADTVSELTARSLTLRQLRDFMRRVPDGHVMVQTVQPKALYTGERNTAAGCAGATQALGCFRLPA